MATASTFTPTKIRSPSFIDWLFIIPTVSSPAFSIERFPMVVASHRFSGSRLFVRVALDMPRDGFARGGRAVAPPGRVHILAMSPRPPPVPPLSSVGGSYSGADRQSHGAARL